MLAEDLDLIFMACSCERWWQNYCGVWWEQVRALLSSLFLFPWVAISSLQ